jgi:hypothetical protein
MQKFGQLIAELRKEQEILANEQARISSAIATLEDHTPSVDATKAGGVNNLVRVRVPQRHLKLSPARQRALKLQGEYMGYLRGLRPRDRQRASKVYETRGLREAVVVAKRLRKAAAR